MMEFVLSKIEFFFGLTGVVFGWFVKLEISRHLFKKDLQDTKSFVKVVNKRVDQLQYKLETMDSEMIRELKSIAESLAYIKGKLGIDK